ncbi:MAG TPA: ABC transporter ATP-binding protein [Myxococcaceae bacterium]|nr:ABC transporter ATP-binding protein [Myxococcaceae bacterium]
MMASGSPQLRLEAIDVGFTYSGESATRALEALSLTVQDQEFLAVLGPVGCGKTTLLRIFAGFLRPTQGSVRCDGASVDGPSPQRGYVLQENAIFPWMTVRENIEFGLLAKGVEPPARRAASDELLGLLGLAAFEAAYPKELSAGMSKMVEVARVLATDPSMLLLDEPFGALDAQTRARMQDELARLWEQRRKTVLFVTHDAEEALYLADRVVVFSPRPGQVKAQFPVNLPRPRSLETKFGAEFSELKRQIWDALRSASPGPGFR